LELGTTGRIVLSSILRGEILYKPNTSGMRLRDVFARNLRRTRQAKNLSQEALAHDAHIDRTYISSLERGTYAASVDMIEKLADVLGIEPDELLRRAPASARVKS